MARRRSTPSAAPSVAPGSAPAEGGPGGPAGLCVIIPAFNEGQSVAAVVEACRAGIAPRWIVVIDDGSTDDTAAKARAAGAAVLSLPINLGIGGAVQAGYRYARRIGATVAVQIDGDGQHDPGEVHRIVEPVLRGTADLVVGSRWLGRGAYDAPPNRRLGMRVLSRAVTWRAGQRFTDTTSGFRAAGQRAIDLFAEEYPSDFPEVETLVLATKRRLRVAEVPVAMRPRKHGNSSIAGLRSAYYMLRVLLVLVLGQPAPPEST